MKKVLVLCLTAIMIASMCVCAFADTGLFVKSPSVNKAPALESFEALSEDCEAKVVITAYADRATLSQAKKDALEDIYEAVAAGKTDALADVFAKLAADKKVDAKKLAISDLFDISNTDCDGHNEHKGFSIKLNAETLKNFVGLVHYKDGKWEVVADAKVVDGDTLTFSVDSLSPFAIVVDSGKLPSDTGDNSNIALWVMVLSASALAVVLVALKKKRA